MGLIGWDLQFKEVQLLSSPIFLIRYIGFFDILDACLEWIIFPVDYSRSNNKVLVYFIDGFDFLTFELWRDLFSLSGFWPIQKSNKQFWVLYHYYNTPN